jgi:hypothetical protein
MIEPYYPHIRLDDEDQLLDVYNGTPSQSSRGGWSLTYWGRDIACIVMNEDLFPGVREKDLVFPAEMLDFYPELTLEIDGKKCFIWGRWD